MTSERVYVEVHFAGKGSKRLPVMDGNAMAEAIRFFNSLSQEDFDAVELEHSQVAIDAIVAAAVAVEQRKTDVRKWQELPWFDKVLAQFILWGIAALLVLGLVSTAGELTSLCR